MLGGSVGLHPSDDISGVLVVLLAAAFSLVMTIPGFQFLELGVIGLDAHLFKFGG